MNLRIPLLLGALALAFAPAPPAHAACFNPAGNAGDMHYNGGYSTMQYCNGGAWVGMGPVGDTTTGLIHRWTLDEGSGSSAADSSGAANATLSGTTTFTASGIFGGGLSLPNDATYKSASVTTPSDMLGKSVLTESMWFKLATNSSQLSVYQQAASGGGDSIGIEAFPQPNAVYFDISDSSSFAGGTAAMAPDTGWHMATLVFDGTQTGNAARLKGYIDGVQQTLAWSGTIPATTTSNARPFDMGGISPNVQAGIIDDVRVYNRPLSPADVLTLYNSTGGASGDIATGLIHWWKLDEAPGATTAGDSTSGASATLSGTTTFTASGKVIGGLSLPDDGTYKNASVTTPADMLGKSALTQSMWFKLATNSSRLSVYQQTASTGADSIGIEAFAGGQPAVYFSLSDTSSYQGAYVAVTPDTGWHMATMVFDGTQTGNAARLKGYIDGVQQTLTFSGTIPATTTSNALPFNMGGLSPDVQAGTIDEIRIYNRALSPADVLTLYNTTRTACTSPAGYAGNLMYNGGTYHVPQFCNNSGTWIAMGKVPGAGGAGCSSPAGSEGDMIYSSDYHAMQYCDGTNWRTTGGNAPISSLASWWNLDDGSGTSATDSSGGGYTGTLTNGASYTASGKFNSAVNFDGNNDYINMPGAPFLAAETQGSMAIWVKSGDPGNSHVIMSSLEGRDKNVYIEGGYYKAGLWDGVSTCRLLDSSTHAPPIAVDAQWHHVVFTWTSATGTDTLYVDGVQAAINNGASWITVGTETGSYLGTVDTFNNACSDSLGGAGTTWNGLLDDARVYSRALSAAEVWQLYNGGP